MSRHSNPTREDPPVPADPSRREFFIRIASVSAVLAAGGALSACGGGGGGSDGDQSAAVQFNYGVASGDPLADRVILWSHARRGSTDEALTLTYEVSADAAFATLVTSGTAVASTETGFTVKADATGLAPGHTYYYRFKSGRDLSPVGRTRTLPGDSTTEVSLAVMACANYPAGFFNVYAELARNEVHCAVHLGDYIYEHEATGFASEHAPQLGRVSQPANELLTLDDYRTRHAQYKSDPDSKTLHARMPMIAVWDDHEFADNAWKNGAQNHDPATEGSWAARRAAAVQAYHEWMPIRTGTDRDKIYRSFHFGNLVSLHMLDTRLIGRDQQVSITDLAGLAGPAAQAAAAAELASPTRQMLGTEQLVWLQGQLASSTAVWQVLGQQVLMARIEVPRSVLVAFLTANTSAAAQAAAVQAIGDYLLAKATPPALRTSGQAALVDPATNPLLGYNTDAWDGYLAARETLLTTVAQLGKKLVCLAGDTHNAWHSDLSLKGLANATLADRKVGEEFACSSVSSPGLEASVSLPSDLVKAVFEGAVHDLKWMDPSRRGYLKMRFTASSATGEWFFVDTVTDHSDTVALGHSASYTG